MRTDSLVAHTDDIHAGSGAEFYGTAIREMHNLDVELREVCDTQQRVRLSLGTDSAPIELLPGEVIKDNLIRRATSSEVVGERFYATPAAGGIADLRESDYWDSFYKGRAL